MVVQTRSGRILSPSPTEAQEIHEFLEKAMASPSPCPSREYRKGTTSYGMVPQVRGTTGKHRGECVFSAAAKKAAEQRYRNSGYYTNAKLDKLRARQANPRLRKDGFPYAQNAFGPHQLSQKPRRPPTKIIRSHDEIKAHTLKKGPCQPDKEGRERTRVQGGPAAGRCVLTIHLAKHLAKGGICESKPSIKTGKRQIQYVANPEYGKKKGARACIKAGGKTTKDKIINDYLARENMTKDQLYANPTAKAQFFKKYEKILCNPNQYYKVSDEPKLMSIEGKKPGWNVGRCVALKGPEKKCKMGEQLFKGEGKREWKKNTKTTGKRAGDITKHDIYKCAPIGNGPKGWTPISGSTGSHPGYNIHTVKGTRAKKLIAQGKECEQKRRVVKGVETGPLIQQVRSATGRCVFPSKPSAIPSTRAKNSKPGSKHLGVNGITFFTPKQTKNGKYRWVKAS